MKAISEPMANKIYDILTEHCLASEIDRKDFVRHQVEGCREYRFQGLLGMGGKIWNTGSFLYVSCYAEHMNDERNSAIEITNIALRDLMLAGF